MNKKFKWGSWGFDGQGAAYIIAKDEVPCKENVADYILWEDDLDPACKSEMVIEQGFCKWQVRSDWDNCEPGGRYVAVKSDQEHMHGWFPVWIIRKGKWYGY